MTQPNAIAFSNPGLIDLTAVKTFGVNVKENENPFGYFGTGLKYALAILLRTGHEVHLYRGEKHIKFGTRTTGVRGKDFKIVTMGDKPLGFTTELGKNWEIWQAYRELYCNMQDEAGSMEVVDYDVERGPYKVDLNSTCFVVKGVDILQIHRDHDEYFLSKDRRPTASDAHVEAHKQPSAKVFYQGVLVGKFSSPSIMTYNFLKGLTLTEDRSLSGTYVLSGYIAKLYFESKDPDFILQGISAPKEYFEYDMDWNWYHKPGETFLEVLSNYYNNQGGKLSESLMKILYRERPTVRLKECQMTSVESQRLRIAIDFCTRIGFPVDEYPIACTESLGENVLGLAEKGKIYISRGALNIGTRMVAETLIEEYIHLKLGHDDLTRDLQNFLFNTIIRLGENYVTKEPL